MSRPAPRDEDVDDDRDDDVDDLADADDDRAEGGAEDEAPPPSYAQPDPRHVIAVALTMCIAVGAAFSSSLAFGRVAFAVLVVAFGAAAVFGVMRSRAEGRAGSLRLKSGDLTLSAFPAALMYALVLGGHSIVFPRGEARELFFLLAYVPLVDPLSDGRHVVAVGAGVVCAFEELALRSLVQPALARRSSDLVGWLGAAAIDALVWAPTLILVGDPRLGWNPVYVGFAAAVALVTGYLRLRTDRVAPAVFCRMLLGWALIEFPVWAP